MELQNALNSDHWRKILEHRKKILLEANAYLHEQASSGLSLDEVGEVSKAPTHLADIGAFEEVAGEVSSLSERTIKEIQLVDDALRRLEKGEFGICQSCRQPIPVERLKVVPEARYCLDCEESREEELKNISPEAADSSLKGILAQISSLVKQLSVEDVMRKNPITVRPHDKLSAAATLMSDNNIRHLPVVDDDGELRGILSDRDFLAIFLKERPGNLPLSVETQWFQARVERIMTTSPDTVEPDTDLVEAGMLLYNNKISCLPVVEGTRLVGILTDSDFVRLAVQSV